MAGGSGGQTAAGLLGFPAQHNRLWVYTGRVPKYPGSKSRVEGKASLMSAVRGQRSEQAADIYREELWSQPRPAEQHLVVCPTLFINIIVSESG